MIVHLSKLPLFAFVKGPADPYRCFQLDGQKVDGSMLETMQAHRTPCTDNAAVTLDCVPRVFQ